jgi:hypothetical protein
MTRISEFAMKRLILVLLPFVFLTSSCVAFFPFDGIIGNGKVITTPYSFSDFSSVENYTSALVYVRHGSVASATVTADENVFEALDIKVENEVLKISTRPGKNILRISQFKVNVVMPSLEQVSLYGSGDIFANDPFSGSDLKLAVMGSGDISGAFSYDKIAATIAGSGSIKASGEADRFAGIIMGSGGLKTGSLTVNDANVSIMGSGSCTVTVIAKINALIAGSGSVYYYGTPAQVYKTKSGSGDLRHLY